MTWDWTAFWLSMGLLSLINPVTTTTTSPARKGSIAHFRPSPRHRSASLPRHLIIICWSNRMCEVARGVSLHLPAPKFSNADAPSTGRSP
jgi:hypothetical protein